MSAERKPPPSQPPGLVEPAGLEASTGYLLARVGSDSRRLWARTLIEEDLTPHHYSALIALAQLGAMSQQQLSHLLGIDARNAVPVIDQLQTRGLLARNPDLADRRRHAVTLTETGRRLLTRLRQAADDAEERMLTPLTTTERRTLHALLAKLFAAGGTG
ncbi:MAG: MarR family winged helix-turn-helix transcriptional regulator [Actinomycetota bacterium]|nr:MarR family winged helix-turn-helix transcriptional regulator [Actinomycetota bacterium]